ncbi:MAG: helix-turn-helix domain-containing protein [Clostridia bacterium]|nr:helix-turn-helix domain-containing protein [Clostridia bacterium]
MEAKEIILELRTKKGFSQEELAEKVFVTRQAVSRWENGETIPNTETLKLLSKLFDVSINTLLGSPRNLICQCCGMPLDDCNISKEKNGLFNEEYCKWCYADGEYTYDNMDDLIDFCAGHMANEHFTPEQVRAYMRDMLPKLNYWKKYTELGGAEKFEQFKKQLIGEFNALYIEGMPEVKELNALVGGYVNLEYTLPNGKTARFLDDGATYLGSQLESELGGDRCFGLVANMEFLLVCTYEENGANPELVIYKKR